MRTDIEDEPRALAWERGPVSVALTDRGIPLWCFRHDSRQANPFFHPGQRDALQLSKTAAAFAAGRTGE
jgi:hypothetical protein